MAGWLILTDRSALDCGEIVGTSNGSCQDVDPSVRDKAVDNSKEARLRRLFDQVLSVSLKEVAGRGCIRPLPIMLGDGRVVDLLELLLVVTERGGSDLVSRDGLWGFVSKELGLDRRVWPSVKLIYVKYLDKLEKWLRVSSTDERLRKCGSECDGCFGSLPLEVETEFRGLLKNAAEQRGKDDGVKPLKSKDGESVDMDFEVSELRVSKTEDKSVRCGDVDEKSRNDDRPILEPSVSKKLVNSHKRKRESLSAMLNWVIQVAKCPNDPSVEAIPDPLKWKEHKGNEYWVQVFRAREALLRRRHVDSNIEKRNQKMHPSMYENHQPSTERLRFSERLPASVESHLHCDCNLSPASENKSAAPQKTVCQNGSKEEAPETLDLQSSNAALGPSGFESPTKQVFVGPFFQAKVPEWTGEVSESDTRWLGICTWPLKHGDKKFYTETDLIGKGRPESCNCLFPGSVPCVRFHIAEKRMKLKLELGSVFYHWKFDRMGEEVSLRWSSGEEKAFKNMIILNASSPSQYFWDNASKSFTRKTREDLVSYYFNVFQIQRRSYQNRVTPKDIDSDDDDGNEPKFGSIGGSFGHEAVAVPGSNILICSQNNQCTDLEKLRE